MTDEANTENGAGEKPSEAAPVVEAAAPAADAPAAEQSNELDQGKVANPADLGGSLAGSAKGEEGETAEGEQKPEGEEKKPEEQPAEGAPEAYEDFKLPEGYEVAPEVSDAFKTAAKDLDLSQEKAQGLVNKMVPIYQDQLLRKIRETATQWAERSKADPEIGGENFPKALRNVARLRDRFAVGADGQVDPDIQEFLNSPSGNHPGVLKLMARAGAAMNEGGFPRGKKDAGVYTAEDFYRDAAKH